jgi:hypothetical protein
MWLACFVNIVVYVFLALVVKGIVVVEKGKLRFPARKDRVSARLAAHRGGSREAGANAMQLLLYVILSTLVSSYLISLTLVILPSTSSQSVPLWWLMVRNLTYSFAGSPCRFRSLVHIYRPPRSIYRDGLCLRPVFLLWISQRDPVQINPANAAIQHRRPAAQFTCRGSLYQDKIGCHSCGADISIFRIV